MEITEIGLLAVGVAAFVASFVIPEKKNKLTNEDKKFGKEKIHEMVETEMQGMQTRISSAVDESVRYAVEKTERSIERLSNEKIMEVNEYSDTVMNEIHRNHEEVVFLYDMLNDKHKNMTQAAAEVEKKAQEAVMTVEKTAEESKVRARETFDLKEESADRGSEKKEPGKDASLYEANDFGGSASKEFRAPDSKDAGREETIEQQTADPEKHIANEDQASGLAKLAKAKKQEQDSTFVENKEETKEPESILPEKATETVMEELPTDAVKAMEEALQNLGTDKEISEEEVNAIPETTGEEPEVMEPVMETGEEEPAEAEETGVELPKEEPEFAPMETERFEKVTPDAEEIKESVIEPVKKETEKAANEKDESAATSATEKKKETKPSKPAKTSRAKGKSSSSIREATLKDFIVNKTKAKTDPEAEQSAAPAPADNSGQNNNERILALHEAGKSNVAIAKELGLGVGEVKLVIDLFKGI